MTNAAKKKGVRARAVLSGDFKIVAKLDDPDATVASMASTAVDTNEEARDQGNDRILRIEEVVAMVGISKQAIYARIRRGTFPKPVPLGGVGPRRAVGWLWSEVRAWLRERARER